MAKIKTLTRRLIMILGCVCVLPTMYRDDKGAVRNNVPKVTKVIPLIFALTVLLMTGTYVSADGFVELTITQSGTGAGTVAAGTGSITWNGDTGTITYSVGTSDALTATAGIESNFGGWVGCDNPSGNTCTMTLNAPKIVSAYFHPNSYNLTAEKKGAGFGTVTGPFGCTCTGIGDDYRRCEMVCILNSLNANGSNGLNCGTGGTDCTEAYNYNTSVTLTATPASGSYFTGWSGDCASTSGNTCTVSMVAAKSVSATFDFSGGALVDLTVTQSGTGVGTVASGTGPIAWNGDTGTITYSVGTSDTLTATAGIESNFEGWDWCDNPAGNTCTMTLDAPKSVSAYFYLNSYNLTVEKKGAGFGTITGPLSCICTGVGYEYEPIAYRYKRCEMICILNSLNANGSNGLNCGTGGTDCTEAYNYNTSVTLTATPASGSYFTGWSGDCASTSGNTCTASILAAKNVSATFDFIPPGPLLSLPENNSTINLKDNQFTWSSVTSAASYELLVDNNSGFGSPEINLTGLATTTYTVTNYLPTNIYYWKVRAKLSDGSYTLWSDPWQFTYSLPVSDAPVWVPLYRMYNNTNKDHFYTTSTTERTDAVANKGYKFEKSEGFVSSLKFNDPNCGYLFRLYNPSTDVHRFTSSESEKDSLIVSGYAYEGITGFIYTKQAEYTSPLFYAEHADNTDHFYTISKFEFQNALNSWGFTNRNLIGYLGNTIANNRPQGQFSGVDLKTGNLRLPAFTDLSMAGAGPQLNFTRYYNSYDDSISALGRGWSYSYDSYVLEDTISGNVRVILGNGGDSSFYQDASGNLVPVPGNFDTLTKINDGINYGYDLLRKDQSLYKFRRYSLNTPGPDILLITFADKHGNTVTLDREASYGLVMSATDASSRTFNFEYTPVTLTTGQIVQRLTKVTDTSLSPNRTVSFSYNADGYLTSVSDARGNSTSYTYNSDGLLSGITFPEGNSVTVVYDALQRVVGNTNGTITLSFDYTSGTKVSNAQGLLAQYTHDSTYRATEVLFPDNAKIVPTYNSDNLLNLPQTVTDRNTNATSYTYDDATGNVLTSKNALNQTTTFTYDDKNNVLTATDPRVYMTTYTYDVNKINLVSVKLPMNGTTTYTYLSSGLVSTVTDPNTHSVTYTYDANGNPTRINDNSFGTYVDFTYDNAGRLLSKTDQLGRTTNYTYDANNNLTQVKDSTNHSATYAYDRNNRLTSITDFRGKATSYTYNSMNVVATETDPAGKVYQYSYDNAGRLSTITAPDGHILSYTYDANNRMTAIKYDGVSKVSFTLYDSNGNLKTVTDDNGTTSFTYDALNRLASYSNSYVGNSVSYGYDASGNRTGITYPGSKSVSYTYDGDNRLTTVLDWLSGTTSYTYDSAGILKSVTNPNGTTAAYAYDAANRLISLANKYSNATAIANYSFTLNSVGNPTQITKNEPLTPTLPASDISYAYDNANKITTAGGLSYTFDDKGNLSAAGGNSFTFDFANRMTQSIIDSVTTQYLYDGFGNRISRTNGGVQTKYVLDLNGDMSQVLAESNSSGNITNYYVYGLGLISKITAAGDRYVYHYDNIGNTIAITDSTGNITEKYAYDEFGKALSVDETNPNMFRYVGKYGVMDEGNGLLFMRARYYDVENARFISKDPLGFEGGDLNLYAYVAENPVMGIDPNGLRIKVVGTKAFVSEINTLLNNLRSNDITKDLIQNLENSKSLTIISQDSGDPDANPIFSEDANENFLGTLINFGIRDKYLDGITADIALAHELGHAELNLRINEGKVHYNSDRYNQIHENYTIGRYENRLRQQRGMALRTSYYWKSTGRFPINARY